MIATHEDGEIWRRSNPAVVLMEVADCTVLDRDGHSTEIIRISYGLKVTPNNQQIDALPALPFTLLGNSLIDGIQCAVALETDSAQFVESNIDQNGDFTYTTFNSDTNASVLHQRNLHDGGLILPFVARRIDLVPGH